MFGFSVFRAVRLIDSCVAITELTQHFFHSTHEEVDWFPQALSGSIVKSLLSLNSIQISMLQLVFFFLVVPVSLSFCSLHWRTHEYMGRLCIRHTGATSTYCYQSPLDFVYSSSVSSSSLISIFICPPPPSSSEVSPTTFLQ
jgi:hypothetical protein